MQHLFLPSDILLPRAVDLGKWSVVACDQYSSEPEYWARVEQTVGDSPSTLRMILPEAHLDGADQAQTAERIVRTMAGYLEQDLFTSLPDSFVYVERTLRSGAVRRGLMGALDLDAYDYRAGTRAPVRASENTVVDRLPPRIAMRENAPLELPHVMVLIDDPGRSVIEPLAEYARDLEPCYDFDLMEQSGHLTGYRVTGSRAERVMADLAHLAEPEVFTAKYGAAGRPVTQMIVGDGNHSLAAAKACWDSLKPGLTPEERERHPARYALVELTNVHDPSLAIEPIHRVVFDAETDLGAAFVSSCENAQLGPGEGYRIDCLSGGGRRTITVRDMTIGQTIGALQSFLDGYVVEHGGGIDYIHGDDALLQLAGRPGSTGFLMPPVEKSDLFKSVIAGGVFPKKSFSMGHAEDKRFYLECRKIK